MIRRSTRLLIILVAFVAPVCIGSAMAQSAVSLPAPGDIYVGIGLGGFFPENTSFRATGTLQGIPLAASGTLRFRPGPGVSLFASYSVNDHLGISTQAGYSHNFIDRFEGNFTVPPLGTFATSSSVKGDVSTGIFLLNGIVTPFGTRHSFVPIVGGGIGFAVSKASLQSTTVLGTPLPIGTVSSAVGLALDIVAGLEYRFTQSDNIGIIYQLIRIAPSDLGSGGGLNARTGAQYSHTIGLLLEHRF